MGHTSIYDKRDNFKLSIAKQVYSIFADQGVFVSQLIRYAWSYSVYECFILTARRLSSKLLKQRYLVETREIVI